MVQLDPAQRKNHAQGCTYALLCCPQGGSTSRKRKERDTKTDSTESATSIDGNVDKRL